MNRLRPRLVVALTLIAAFAFSGIALAATEGDTVLNYGYDENSHFFMWNVTSLDWEPDEQLLENLLEGDPDLDDIGLLLAACGLEASEGEDEIVYDYTVDDEDNITLSVDGEEVDLTSCGELHGGDITGPNGQVNHGMFMKFFNEHYEGEHRGCIVSQIARSGLGKGDQQVKAGDSEPEEGVSEEVTEEEDPTITFTTIVTDCERDETDDEDGDRRGNGPPQHVLDKFGGHPKDAKGKPAHAGGGRP